MKEQQHKGLKLPETVTVIDFFFIYLFYLFLGDLVLG